MLLSKRHQLGTIVYSLDELGNSFDVSHRKVSSQASSMSLEGSPKYLNGNVEGTSKTFVSG